MQESAFSEAELNYYEKYWDSIRLEKAAFDDVCESFEKERQEKEVAIEKNRAAIKIMYKNNIDLSIIAKTFEITEDEIKVIVKE